MIYTPYPRVNCLKTIPFTAAHTYIAHIWQYPPTPGTQREPPRRREKVSYTIILFLLAKTPRKVDD